MLKNRQSNNTKRIGFSYTKPTMPSIYDGRFLTEKENTGFMSIHKRLYSPTLQTIARYGVGLGLHTAFSLNYTGLENIPKEGPFILAANHMKMCDSFLIGLGTEKLHMGMGKEEYYFWPGIKQLLTWLGAFPVARKIKYEKLMRKYGEEKVKRYLLAPDQFNYDEYVPAALREEFLADMKQTLYKHEIRDIQTLSSTTLASYFIMKGEGLLIHIEGTRHADGVIRDVYPGAAKVALDVYQKYKSNIALLPCAIAYQEPCGFRSNVDVVVGRRIALGEYKGETGVNDLTKKLENKVKELYEEAKKLADE